MNRPASRAPSCPTACAAPSIGRTATSSCLHGEAGRMDIAQENCGHHPVNGFRARGLLKNAASGRGSRSSARNSTAHAGRTESRSNNLFANRTSTATLFASASTLRLSPAAEAFRRLGLAGAGDDRAQVGRSSSRLPSASPCAGFRSRFLRPAPEPFARVLAGGGGADVAPFAVPAAPLPPESRGHGIGMFALAAARRRSRPQPRMFVFCSGKGA